MAKIDSACSRILQYDGLKVLGSVVSMGTSREKCAAALALLSLSFHETASVGRGLIRAAIASDVNAQLATLRGQMPVSISAEGRQAAMRDVLEDYRSLKTWILEKSNLLPEVKAISPVDRRVKTALWMQSVFRRLQWEIHVDGETKLSLMSEFK